MKFLFKLIQIALVFTVFTAWGVNSRSIQAAEPNCNSIQTDPDPIFDNSPQATFIIDVGDTAQISQWVVQFECGGNWRKENATIKNSRKIQVTIKNEGLNPCEFSDGNHTINVQSVGGTRYCRSSYVVEKLTTTCKLNIDPPKPKFGDAVKISGNNPIPVGAYLWVNPGTPASPITWLGSGNFGPVDITQYLRVGENTAYLNNQRAGGTNFCTTNFFLGNNIPGPVFRPTPCKEGTPQEGIETALGCIPTKNTTGFIAWILKFAIGIGGGIAFILMLIGAFQIITSAGDPERLKAGKELITSALIGLLMIIFSLFLLKLIGVDILQIPGFGPQNPGGGGGGTGKNLLM